MDNYKNQLLSFITKIYSFENKTAWHIVEQFQFKQVAKQTNLLKEGKVSDEYFFVCNGFARSFVIDADGNEVTTNFYKPNSIMIELASFFKRIPSTENFETLTDCEVLFLTYQEVQKLFHTEPQFREFGRLMLVNSYANLKQKMYNNIKLTAEQRYLNLINQSPEIFQLLSLKQIASFLNIADTSLSRIRKELMQH